MFGYVAPQLSSLTLEDKDIYQAFYCGLCRAIGGYGLSSRMSLTYDGTFMAALLTSVQSSELCVPYTKKGCVMHPLQGKRPSVNGSDVLDYCAAVCVMLCRDKLRDDVRDGRAARGMLIPLVAGGRRKAAKKYPDAAAIISDGLEELYALEDGGCTSFDAAPTRFGKLMADVITAYPIDEDKKLPLYELAKAIGCFIYVCDAWDDRESDKRRGLYNVFNITEHDARFAEALLDMYCNSAEMAYDLLDTKLCESLLDNIIYNGLRAAARDVLEPPKRDSSNEGSFR